MRASWPFVFFVVERFGTTCLTHLQSKIIPKLGVLQPSEGSRAQDPRVDESGRFVGRRVWLQLT
jgi:hypothetical protein